MWLDFENYRPELKRIGIETSPQLGKALLADAGLFKFTISSNVRAVSLCGNF